MQDCQEEYLANPRRFAALSQRKRPEGPDCQAYTAQVLADRFNKDRDRISLPAFPFPGKSGPPEVKRRNCHVRQRGIY